MNAWKAVHWLVMAVNQQDKHVKDIVSGYFRPGQGSGKQNENEIAYADSHVIGDDGPPIQRPIGQSQIEECDVKKKHPRNIKNDEP
jgi:hypothetical protein